MVGAVWSKLSFNPLDRVKFVQILLLGVLRKTFGSETEFQSPRSGQICSNLFNEQVPKDRYMFQSPRSGQICSNTVEGEKVIVALISFNPLDRVKFVQIYWAKRVHSQSERGRRFQSPRSGQICSNSKRIQTVDLRIRAAFQSPRSGQICSNSYKSNPSDNFQEKSFNPLDRVKFV